MKRTSFLLFIVVILITSACSKKKEIQLSSPDKSITLKFTVENGVAYYSIAKDGKTIIEPSRLGFKFYKIPILDSNFIIKDFAQSTFDETWEQPWGEKRLIRNNYNEVMAHLEEKTDLKRKLTVIFRVFDDGVGFRYQIPEQPGIDSIEIADEETEFAFNDNHSAWWIPAYRDNRYEYLYKKSLINDLDTVHTPLTIETTDGLFLSIHEANLTNYASMTVYKKSENVLKCDLIPWSDGVKVYGKTPFETPWRTIKIAKTAGELITSYLMLNLNEPCKIEDVSWIKPVKYIGIWWGMHIDKYTWSQGLKHGATTKNVKAYIDFASKYGFDAVLVEGWNEGWDGNWVENGSIFNFTKPYPDFDIAEISKYAASKNIKIIGHHETGADVKNYDRQMEDAYKFYNKYGIKSVKSGYVGSRMDHKEWHHSQYGVLHYRKALEMAAKYHIMINVHEPIKPTGICRTFPNLMSAEGARGQEYNAWSNDGGNPPEHETILPFTRILAGPMDFTPGIFNIEITEKPNNQVNTTLAKQLALYVVLYSPVLMAADLPENYEKNLAPFSFILDVPVDWEETKVLNGAIGDYITIVRRDRNSPDWFLGSLTDENSREFDVKLSFLEPGKNYTAKIYADGSNADFKTNPLSITIEEKNVTSDSTLHISLAPGGGQAVSFKRIK